MWRGHTHRFCVTSAAALHDLNSLERAYHAWKSARAGSGDDRPLVTALIYLSGEDLERAKRLYLCERGEYAELWLPRWLYNGLEEDGAVVLDVTGEVRLVSGENNTQKVQVQVEETEEEEEDLLETKFNFKKLEDDNEQEKRTKESEHSAYVKREISEIAERERDQLQQSLIVTPRHPSRENYEIISYLEALRESPLSLTDKSVLPLFALIQKCFQKGHYDTVLKLIGAQFDPTNALEQ